MISDRFLVASTSLALLLPVRVKVREKDLINLLLQFPKEMEELSTPRRWSSMARPMFVSQMLPSCPLFPASTLRWVQFLTALQKLCMEDYIQSIAYAIAEWAADVIKRNWGMLKDSRADSAQPQRSPRRTRSCSFHFTFLPLMKSLADNKKSLDIIFDEKAEINIM